MEPPRISVLGSLLSSGGVYSQRQKGEGVNDIIVFQCQQNLKLVKKKKRIDQLEMHKKQGLVMWVCCLSPWEVRSGEQEV